LKIDGRSREIIAYFIVYENDGGIYGRFPIVTCSMNSTGYI
jgi:hypothetical protein